MAHVKSDGTARVDPSEPAERLLRQVPFARLAVTLDQLAADPTVHAVVVCSCPSRIDDDTTVMQQVREMARGQPKVQLLCSHPFCLCPHVLRRAPPPGFFFQLLLTFSYAGNAASTLLRPF